MTTICELIEQYERNLWFYLSDLFRLRLRGSELACTYDLVYKITAFCDRQRTCEVYTFYAKNEVKRGADIDLFVFNETSYDHFMIQSKIMDFHGSYYDIGTYRTDAQYCKLINVSKVEGAFPLYLLFSGKTPNSNEGKAEFGCSIIWAEKIKDYRFNQYSLKKLSGAIKTPQVKFNGLFEDLKPLHILFCQKYASEFKLPIGKSYDEIYKEFPYNKTSFSLDKGANNLPDEQDETLDSNAIGLVESLHLAPIRIIIREATKDRE